MKTIGIFYGSSGGNTQSVAEQIAKNLGVDKSNLFDVAKVSVDKFLTYDVLFLGSSTWGLGDLQDDWEGLADQLSKQNLSGKDVAIFGTGDSSSYSDTFCDAMAILSKAAIKAGAKLVGEVDSSNYSFDDSQAVVNGKFCGLALDVDNEDNLTNDRINNWIKIVKSQAGI